MTKEQVDALIREIGPTGFKSGPHEYLGFTKQKLELLIKLVRNAALTEAIDKARIFGLGLPIAQTERLIKALESLKEPTP